MPRVGLNEEKYAADDLRRHIKYLLTDTNIAEVATRIGCSQWTLYDRKKNPEQFRIGEIRKLCGCVRMSAEDKDKLRKLIVP